MVVDGGQRVDGGQGALVVCLLQATRMAGQAVKVARADAGSLWVCLP